VSEVLAYVAAGLVGLWGVAHAVPTRQVLAGFEPIMVDNRRVLLQEWLAEAFTVRGAGGRGGCRNYCERAGSVPDDQGALDMLSY
jgi:citrate synthase